MENKATTLQLVNMELLNVRLNKPETKLPDNMVFNYNVNLKHQLNPENEIINIIASIAILHEDKETELGFVQTACAYKIEDLNEYVKDETNEVSLPQGILNTLNAASISTSRGIMFSQFRGTFLHKAQLPLVDPSGFKKS